MPEDLQFVSASNWHTSNGHMNSNNNKTLDNSVLGHQKKILICQMYSWWLHLTAYSHPNKPLSRTLTSNRQRNGPHADTDLTQIHTSSYPCVENGRILRQLDTAIKYNLASTVCMKNSLPAC